MTDRMLHAPTNSSALRKPGQYSYQAKIAPWVCVLLFQALLAGATDSPPQLPLSSAPVPVLQAHSGQRVILTGYFRHGFESSTLLPAEQRPEELTFERAVWVDFAEGEEWKFLGFPFRGNLKVGGILKAEPGKGYGHLGGTPAELTNARIQGLLPRDCGMIAGIIVVICFVGVALSRGRRRL